jgi:hemerythrin-like domain-containing protein
MRSQTWTADEKIEKLGTFVDMLRAHSEAEETTLYEFLQEDRESQVMTFEAIEEHAMAKILMDELEAMNFRSRWSNEIEAKANVLMELMEHHMKDEEKDLFPQARRLLNDGEREILGREFLRRYEFIQSEKDAIQHLINPNNTTHTL